MDIFSFPATCIKVVFGDKMVFTYQHKHEIFKAVLPRRRRSLKEGEAEWKPQGRDLRSLPWEEMNRARQPCDKGLRKRHGRLLA